MATTVTAATLTVRVVESLVLGGVDYTNADEPALSIASIAWADRRTVRVLTSTDGTEILKFSTTDGAGQYVATRVKYLRIVNRDDTNYVTLHIQTASSDYVQLKLEAGKSVTLPNALMDNASDMDSFSFTSLSSIQGLANTAACDVQYFICGTAS